MLEVRVNSPSLLQQSKVNCVGGRSLTKCSLTEIVLHQAACRLAHNFAKPSWQSLCFEQLPESLICGKKVARSKFTEFSVTSQRKITLVEPYHNFFALRCLWCCTLHRTTTAFVISFTVSFFAFRANFPKFALETLPETCTLLNYFINPMTILVTGGAGFIGANFVRYLLQNSSATVVNLDALTYAGNLENLREVEAHPRYSFVHGSLQNRELLEYVCLKHGVTGIINFAAESHVDRSILSASAFIDTNVQGTLTLLEVAKTLHRKGQLERYVQVSTDEVYGSLGDTGAFTEDSPLAPNSPYAASKASSDMLVRAFVHTHGLPALITRCSNNYGPYQFPEKLIPLMIANALEGKPLPVYGDGMNVRDWIYVEDHCAAVWAVYERGRVGEVYNAGGASEKPNIDVVKTILRLVGKSESLIKYVTDRPGHDRRYAIDFTKIHQELGWKPRYSFDEGLQLTIDWYMANTSWLERVRSGAYMAYYEQQYGKR
jgi:dTDP-glucose 4,6-dehydratase